MKKNKMPLVLIFAVAIAGRALAAGPIGEEHSGGFWSEYGHLIWSVANFCLLVYLLFHFSWKRIVDFMNARREKIKKELEEAEEAEKKAEEKVQASRELLGQLDEKVKIILEEARSRAEEEKQEIIGRAREEVERILQDAERRAQEELARARSRLRAEVADLAVRLAEDIVKRKLNKKTQKRIVRRCIDRMTELS